jgi:hypothetical protein
VNRLKTKVLVTCPHGRVASSVNYLHVSDYRLRDFGLKRDVACGFCIFKRTAAAYAKEAVVRNERHPVAWRN